MEHGQSRHSQRRRRRRCLILSVVVVLFLITVVALVLGLTLRPVQDEIRSTFIARCKKLREYDCHKIWDAFEQAYVGRDPCKVPVEAYDPFIAVTPFTPACNRMMFWSKTKDMVHAFTEKNDCFVTLEDTVLGYIADGLTWCGKEGSSETFTTGCPGWTDCENNPVRSFWNRVSATFAEAACGNVTAMLNGSIPTPFSPVSVFGSVEVKRFNASKIDSLNIILATQKNSVANCTNASFQDLQEELDKGITYTCKEVAESQILDCSSSLAESCHPCW